MKIVKTTYQNTEAAHETAYIIKGIFKKRFYYLSELGVVELKIYPIGKARDDKEA